MDMLLLTGMAGTVYFLSEIADPQASCFPAFELWPANRLHWGRSLEVNSPVKFVMPLSALVMKTWRSGWNWAVAAMTVCWSEHYGCAENMYKRWTEVDDGRTLQPVSQLWVSCHHPVCWAANMDPHGPSICITIYLFTQEHTPRPQPLISMHLGHKRVCMCVWEREVNWSCFSSWVSLAWLM